MNTRQRLTISGVLIIGALLFILVSPIHAGILLSASADGSGVRTPVFPNGVDTAASCKVTLWVTDDETALRYRVECFQIDGVTEAHIHVGDKDTILSVGTTRLIGVFGLPVSSPYVSPKVPTGQINGLLTEDVIYEGDERLVVPLSRVIDDLKSGSVFVNIATKSHDRGEVRGQFENGNHS